jgi:hypothetical protein
MTFIDFINAYRSLSAESHELALKRMYLLVEMKPLAAVWRSGPYTSWNRLLTGEHMCPVAKFDSFEAATRILKRKTIEKIGVDCACVVARVEETIREALLSKILGFVEVYRVPPTRQVCWSYVHTLRFIPPQTKEAKAAARSAFLSARH